MMLVATAPSVAGEGPPPDAKAAFEKLKGMAGRWTATSPDLPAGEAAPEVEYRVVASGTAVVEELFVGTPHEMVSVYHLDGDDLVMTHYCAQGNQPRQKYDPKASGGTTLAFAFAGGANLDPSKDSHMHESQYVFKEGGEVEARWTGWSGGKPAGTHVVTLTRR
jgi:hypothetical protein